MIESIKMIIEKIQRIKEKKTTKTSDKWPLICQNGKKNQTTKNINCLSTGWSTFSWNISKINRGTIKYHSAKEAEFNGIVFNMSSFRTTLQNIFENKHFRVYLSRIHSAVLFL